MSKHAVAVKKAGDPAGNGLFQRIDKALDSIRARAYELFRSRGAEPENDLDDWFRAERELFDVPPIELTENGHEFVVNVIASGFEANQLEVAVDDDWLTIHGEAEQKREKTGDTRNKELFCRFTLPVPIDAGHVKATLSGGFLKVTLPKATADAQHKVAA